MKVTMSNAGFKVTGKSRSSEPLDANEAEQVLADMFIELCKELSQFSAPSSKLRQLDIHPERASAFVRRFLANNQFELRRRVSMFEPGELASIGGGSGGGGSARLPMNVGFVSTPGTQF